MDSLHILCFGAKWHEENVYQWEVRKLINILTSIQWLKNPTVLDPATTMLYRTSAINKYFFR
jgi:hypothetical protein